MPKFMVILHNAPDVYRKRSPEELQQTFTRYQSWMEGTMRASGRYVSGEKLVEEGGKRLSRQTGELTIMDGPYSEAKEVVGGYFVFRAASYEEAVQVLRDSPFLNDCRVELRQTDPMGCGGD